jgi:hypothetical protein
MACLLTQNISYCDFSTGGLKKLYLTNKSLIDSVEFTNDNLGLIADYVSRNTLYWFDFDLNKDTANLTEVLEDTGRGDLYRVTLDNTYIELDFAKRRIFEEMIKGELVAIVQDNNNKYWSIGEQDGLRVTSYQSTTDLQGGVNRYTLQLTAFQRFQVREVDFNNLSEFWVAIEDCSIYQGLPLFAIPPPIAVIADCLIDFSN